MKIMLFSWGLVHSLLMYNTSALEKVQQAPNIEQDILISGVPVMFRTLLTNSATEPTRFSHTSSSYTVNTSRKAIKQAFPLNCLQLMALFWELASRSGKIFRCYSRIYCLHLQSDWIGVWVDASASIQTHSFTLKWSRMFLRNVRQFNDSTLQKPKKHNLINNRCEQLSNKIYVCLLISITCLTQYTP
jgi:hypothetical protein